MAEEIVLTDVAEVRVGEDVVIITLRSGKTFVVEPSYSHEILRCRDEDCVRENIYLEVEEG